MVKYLSFAILYAEPSP